MGDEEFGAPLLVRILLHAPNRHTLLDLPPKVSASTHPHSVFHPKDSRRYRVSRVMTMRLIVANIFDDTVQWPQRSRRGCDYPGKMGLLSRCLARRSVIAALGGILDFVRRMPIGWILGHPHHDAVAPQIRISQLRQFDRSHNYN